jgi:hypothetical protein
MQTFTAKASYTGSAQTLTNPSITVTSSGTSSASSNLSYDDAYQTAVGVAVSVAENIARHDANVITQISIFFY